MCVDRAKDTVGVPAIKHKSKFTKNDPNRPKSLDPIYF